MSTLSTVHVSELAALEAAAFADITDHESFVTGWEEIDGFVYVNGSRAKGGHSINGIQARSEYSTTCARCKELKLRIPLALVVRFEHAIGRLMFYFVGSLKREQRPTHCSGCAGSEAPQLALFGGRA